MSEFPDPITNFTALNKRFFYFKNKIQKRHFIQKPHFLRPYTQESMQEKSLLEPKNTVVSIEFGLLFDLLLSEPIITSKHKNQNDNQPNKESSNTIT